MSRCGQAGPSRAGSPSSRAIAYAAAVWPCGTDRAMVTGACPAGTRASPFRAASTASTTGPGSFDRLAMVLFRTVLPSR